MDVLDNINKSRDYDIISRCHLHTDNIFGKIKGRNIFRYLFYNFQNHVILTPPLFVKLANLTKFC